MRTSLVFVLACSAFGQTITTVAGTGVSGFNGDGIPAVEARLNLEVGDPFADQEDIIHITVDGMGNLYIPDRGNNRVRRVSPDGRIATVAGNGQHSYGGDGGPALQAALDWPAAVIVDAAGNLYVADQHNNRIRRVTPAGTISAFAGNGVHSYSGNGGQALQAALDYPTGLALDAAGNLYISDQHNSQVRRVSTDGVINGFAGTTEFGFSGDGGPATRATMDFPGGLAVDSAGNVYITDQYNSRIRRVAPNGVITTVAGNGIAGFSGDGGQAVNASLNFPVDVALDSAGNLYIADQRNHRIRRVSNGIITTVAGIGAAGFGGDGGPAVEAALNRPSGVAVDAAGNLYITDHFNGRIRKVSASGPAFPSNGVASAASFLGGHIAPGQIISIFGTNLGPATGVGVALDPATGRVATTRGGVTVLFNDVPGPLFFVQQNQINVQAPYELAGQTSARVVVRAQTLSSAAVAVPVGPSAPGVFTVNATGRGQAALLNQDLSLNSAANPAARGSTVVLYLTGQGATNPPAITGELPQGTFPQPALSVSVSIGGKMAQTSFIGLAPGLAGLLQINAIVPEDVTPGNAVELSVTIGTASIQAGVTLAVR